MLALQQQKKPMIIIYLLVIICSFISVTSIVMGDAVVCSYSDQFVKSNYRQLQPKQEITMGQIPKGQGEVIMFLKSNQEIHFKFTDSQGLILMNNLNTDMESTFHHEGMQLTTCVGKCQNEVVQVSSNANFENNCHFVSTFEFVVFDSPVCVI